MDETRISFEQGFTRRDFRTYPPKPVTIAGISDNFEADEIDQNVHKQRSGSQRPSTNPTEILEGILVSL